MKSRNPVSEPDDKLVRITGAALLSHCKQHELAVHDGSRCVEYRAYILAEMMVALEMDQGELPELVQQAMRELQNGLSPLRWAVVIHGNGGHT